MFRMFGICFAVPEVLRRSFSPPAQFAGDFGSYISPLMFEDGTPVGTGADWAKRREQIYAFFEYFLKPISSPDSASGYGAWQLLMM